MKPVKNSNISDKQKRVPYSERSDLEKIKTNITKTSSLLNKREYGMAIVRSATSVELAANLLIRNELILKRQLEVHFVDNLLIWANGISGKFNKILLPLFKKQEEEFNILKKIKERIEDINTERNSVSHSGSLKNKKNAVHVLKESKEVINILLELAEENPIILKK